MDALWGAIRPLIPGAVGLLVNRYGLPASLQGPLSDVIAIGGPTLIMTVWGGIANTTTSLAKRLAAAKGTEVSATGATIKLVDPSLQAAAAKAATDVNGQK